MLFFFIENEGFFEKFIAEDGIGKLLKVFAFKSVKQWEELLVELLTDVFVRLRCLN